MLGLTINGGFAEYMKADARVVSKIPESIPWDQAAPLVSNQSPDCIKTCPLLLTGRISSAQAQPSTALFWQWIRSQDSGLQ